MARSNRDTWYFDDDEEVAEQAAQTFQDNHPQLREVSTQINLTTPTAASITAEAEKISSGSGSLAAAVGGSTSSATAAASSAVANGKAAVGQLVGGNSTVDKLKATMESGISSASIMGIPADFVSKAFQNSNLNFLDKNLAINTQAGNFSTGLSDAINGFNSALKSATGAFTTEAANLQRKGLTFLASTTSKIIDGIDLPGLSELGSFASAGLGQLGKLASMGGEALRSVGDGLKAVVNTVGSAIATGKQALNTVVNSVVQPLAQTGSAILSPVKDVLSTAYTLTDPRFAASIVSSNLDFLPGPLQAIAAQKTAQMVASVTGNFNDKVANMLNKTYALDSIFGAGSTGNLLEGIYQFGNGYGSYGSIGASSYGGGSYNLASSSGGYVYGVSSYTGEAKQYQDLASAVSTLCGDANIKTDWDAWGDDRDLFDMLLQAAMQTGAGQLVQALMNCGKSSSYYSGRSTNIVRNAISTVALSGDVYTYRSLVEQKGAEVVANPEQDILALFVNSVYTDETNKDIEAVMHAVDITMEDVISTGEKAGGKYTVLDSGKVTVMQQADQKYQQAFLAEEDYAAVNAALALYGSTA